MLRTVLLGLALLFGADAINLHHEEGFQSIIQILMF